MLRTAGEIRAATAVGAARPPVWAGVPSRMTGARPGYDGRIGAWSLP